MKKFYLVIMAAMFFTATFAQLSTREDATVAQLKGSFTPKTATIQRINMVNTPQRALCAPVAKTQKKADATVLPTEMITEQPAGKLYKNLYRQAKSFYGYNGYAYGSTIDGYTGDVVKADDGTVYIKNPISTIRTNTWLKGKLTTNDTIEVQLPQLFYQEEENGEMQSYYVYRMCLNQDESWYVTDSVSQTIKYVMHNDSVKLVGDSEFTNFPAYVIGMCDADGDWEAYADYATTLFTCPDQAYAPADPSSATRCVMTYKKLANSYSTTGTDDLYLDTAIPQFVDVVVEGSDIYLKGLYTSAPELWLKGTIEGNKATFKCGSYLGADETMCYHIYFEPTTSAWVYSDYYGSYFAESEKNNTDAVFDYDAEAKTLTYTGEISMNIGKANTDITNTYVNPNIPLAQWVETAGTPMAPEFFNFQLYSRYGFIRFYIDCYTTDGVYMDPDKVYYNVYLDDEVLTFAPPTYTKLTESMTNVPLTFTDDYDIFFSGRPHTVYFYNINFDKIGVSVTYTGGGETHTTDIVWYQNPTSIKATTNTTSSEVVAETYTDLSGRRVSTPAHGIYIKSMKFADGTTKNIKVVK